MNYMCNILTLFSPPTVFIELQSYGPSLVRIKGLYARRYLTIDRSGRLKAAVRTSSVLWINSPWIMGHAVLISIEIRSKRSNVFCYMVGEENNSCKKSAHAEWCSFAKMTAPLIFHLKSISALCSSVSKEMNGDIAICSRYTTKDRHTSLFFLIFAWYQLTISWQQPLSHFFTIIDRLVFLVFLVEKATKFYNFFSENLAKLLSSNLACVLPKSNSVVKN